MSKTLVKIYTDGGCNPNPGPGGWGFVFEGANGSFFLENSGGQLQTTNNIMEMTAALEALQLALKNGQKLAVFGELVVHSDSKYLIDGITKWVKNWEGRSWKTAEGKPVKNIPQWKALLHVQQNLLERFGIRVRWKWVKGHSGVPGNERADELATKGRHDTLHGLNKRQPKKADVPMVENPHERVEALSQCLFKIIQRVEDHYHTFEELGEFAQIYFDACKALNHTPVTTRKAA